MASRKLILLLTALVILAALVINFIILPQIFPPKTTPIITWSNPADITYGTLLGNQQLDATANVDGKFNYTPPAGTRLEVGNQTLHADFTPADKDHFTSASAQVMINVKPVPAVKPVPSVIPVAKLTPAITWDTPVDITVGMPLGAKQLNAQASVQGTNVLGSFNYTPPAGKILPAGYDQPLRVDFTPMDTAHFTSASAQVLINVMAAPLVTPSVQPVVPVVPAKSSVTNKTINKALVNQTQMIFLALHPNPDKAIADASWQVNDANNNSLQEIKKSGQTALVVLEASQNEGDVLDFDALIRGDYDGILQDTFDTLGQKSGDGSGIIYAILSEVNNIGNVPSEKYVAGVNHIASIIRTTQPEAQTAILLDSLTDNEGSWTHSKLDAWIDGLDKANIDVFILQGFPKSIAYPNEVDASKFINADEVARIANKLGTKTIIVHTGIASNYRGTVSLLSEKQAIMISIEQEMLKLKQLAPDSKIVLSFFADNKSKEKENVDWSFKQEDYRMLSDAIANMTSHQIEVSFRDIKRTLKSFLNQLT